VNAREKAAQAEAAARRAVESARRAREISDQMSRPPTAVSLDSDEQIGENQAGCLADSYRTDGCTTKPNAVGWRRGVVVSGVRQ